MSKNQDLSDGTNMSDGWPNMSDGWPNAVDDWPDGSDWPDMRDVGKDIGLQIPPMG